MNEQSKIMEKLENAYTLLQSLSIQPTKSNMGILLTVMDAIKSAYGYLTTLKVETEEVKPDEP